MDKETAIAKLDSVISKSRVEMYKPIQVAEVLHAARTDSSIKLQTLETYRTQSKQLRDKVTSRLFNKVSTSSAKFQDDIWSETAVSPDAMKALGEINRNTGVIEEYIYQCIWAKNSFLIRIRDSLEKMSTISDISKLFADFDTDGMRSSADRLFEIFTVSVLHADAAQIGAVIKIIQPLESSNIDSSAARIIRTTSNYEQKLHFSRIGHTNAADAGLDIWTNFGVIVSVKNYLLDEQLLRKVLQDTPIGKLVISCDSYTPGAIKMLNSDEVAGDRTVTVITKADLFKDAERLMLNHESALHFLNTFISNFDHEFPRNTTLEVFMKARGYRIQLPKRPI